MEISFKNNKNPVRRGEADSQPTSSPRQHKKVELPSRLRCAIVDELCSQHRLPVSMCSAEVRLLVANWNFVVVAELPLGRSHVKSSLCMLIRGVGEWWYSSMHSHLDARWR